MLTIARMHAAAARGRSVTAALIVAALTFGAGAGTAGVSNAAGPGAVVADAAAGSGIGSDASYTTDAATGATVTLAAGRTPGEFGVTHSGAATYRIPLWTPPGIGEVELGLALVYNSRSGTGTLGQGWSLAGLSSISRCNRTVAQDGMAAGVTGTLSDRFCLDGMQLKLVSGAYGAAGSVYGTEIESFARVVANGASGNGPSSFTVTTRNGLIYEYGGTPDSRIHAGNTATVRTWAVSRIRDRATPAGGNSILLTWHNEAVAGAYGNGSHRIASIAYPAPANGGTPFYTVSFEYSARPAGDVPIGYLAGSVIREPNQLDAIAIRATGSSTPIKRYQMTYATAPTTGRLRLAAVQECAAASCMRATTIGYQDGASGWQGMVDTGVTTSANKAPLPVDLNGDGLTDLLYAVDVPGGKFSWRILLANPSGHAPPLDTGIVSTGSLVIPGQFVGNGRTQFLVQLNGYWHVAGFGGNGFVVANTGLAPSGEYGAADFDGDGLSDLMAQSGGFTPTIVARRNVTVPAGGAIAAQFAATTQFVWTVPAPRQSLPWDNLRVADFNGDGRADVVALSFNQSDRNPKFFATSLLSNGFDAPFTFASERQIVQESMVTLGDWNADGCSDIIQVQYVYVSNCAGAFSQVATTAGPATGASLYTAMPADWNGDGRTDLMYVDASTEDWMIVPSTGSGAGAVVATGIDARKTTTWFVHDTDGDGLVDLGYRDGTSNNRLRYHLHAGAMTPADLATRFTDGFGMVQSPTYGSITRSAHHTAGTGAAFPETDFQAPLYVVSEAAIADGTGGTYRNEFHYFGARLHLQGRGFEGFLAQRVRDSRTGFYTLDHVERAFPFTGMHVQRTVYQPDGATRILEWRAQPATQAIGSSGFEQRRFRFAASETERRFELGGALNGSLTSESTTSFAYADGYGNPTLVQRSVTDKDPQSPFLGSTWQSTANYTYSNDTSANWCLGLPSSASLTETAPGKTAMTRTRAYAVDTQACRVTQQVLEPSTAALKVTTNYSYDGCGNLESLQVVGSNANGTAMPARTTRFNYGARCQLPESVTNALGQATTYAYQYDFGLPTRATDPNGLSTQWSYDEFGRRTRETRPDQTGTAWAYDSCNAGPCWGLGDLRFLVYESRLDANVALVRTRLRFYDGYERLRYDEADRVLGVWTNVVHTYDALGRPVAETRPFSAYSNGSIRRTFDALGRPTTLQVLDVPGNVMAQHTASYAGRTTTVTNPLGQPRSLVHDVAGHLRRVTDPAPGGTTRYDHDSLGNLARVEDPIGAVSSGTWNVRGFRTRWADSDAGTWTFTGNSLNERVAWKDAKGKSFSATYDALGRLVSRTEPEGKSTWTWGTAAAQRNIGRLKSRSGLGYTEAFDYDAAGRISARTITTDQAYRYDYAYNPIGEIDTLTYPTSPVPSGQSGTRLAIRYGYSFGEVARIDDVTSAAQPRALWSLGAANDDGAPTMESVANGAASITTGFDRATGRLTSLQAGAGGQPASRQNLEYAWDPAGNLTRRRDANRNLMEEFAHDALDRIVGSQVNGVASLSVTYDAAGNVRQKSDVGTYTYGNSAKRHAVTKAGSETLSYDANGNVSARNGLTQTWASFNLPTVVRKSGQQSTFAYGPDHQRWRQVATYPNGTETTHYVGGLLEKEATTSTGRTYWRHYVPTPGGSTAVVSRNSDGTTTTRYLLSDHLGSTDAVLDENGGAAFSTSFSAFGTRRGSDWKAATAPDWAGIANTTRQGYTGHEALDNLGLVHMGGRVYDPGLGRFLSADPLIGDLADSQSVNPYAYVGNRPLRDVDPTGYFADCAGVCTFLAMSVMRSILNVSLFGGHDHVFRPPATAIPGQTAQSGAAMCGPGMFSSVCGGSIIYKSAAPVTNGGPGTSTWSIEGADDPYAAENLQLFFVDLGVNAVDVLILSPVRDAKDAVDAARSGDYWQAAILTGTTICNVAKPCKGLEESVKGVKRVAKAVKGNKQATRAVTNPVPPELARVVPGNLSVTTLGRPGDADVFVTAADDIAGLNASQLAERLTIPAAETFKVIRFPTPAGGGGIAAPVFRSNPGFVQGGLTRGGAREYVIPNGPVPPDAVIEVVR